MDPSAQYPNQTPTAQPYPPSSQPQPYDQSTQAYYQQYTAQYNQTEQQQQQQQQYPYYPQQYAAYQPSGQDSSPIQPPGVTAQPDSTAYSGTQQGFGQAYGNAQQDTFYPAGVVAEQQQQPLIYSDPAAQGQQWQGNTGEVGLMHLYPSKQFISRCGVVEEY